MACSLRPFLLFLILVLALFFGSNAQSIKLEIVTIDTSLKTRYDSTPSDSVELADELSQVVEFYQKKGFATCGYDRLDLFDDSVKAYFYLGPKFNKIHIKQGNVPEEWWLARSESLRQKSFRQIGISKKRIIEKAENNGYPFARIFFDSIHVSDALIEIIPKIEHGPLILFDSLTVIGKDVYGRRYLHHHLGIKPESPYDERKAVSIERVVARDASIKLTGPIETRFADNHARMYLPLDYVPSNQFDVLIGFLPNSRNDGKLLINGQAEIILNNMFRAGKRLELEWRKIQVSTQTLSTSYLHRHLFGSDLHVKLGLDLFKQDSTFLTIDRFVGLVLSQSAYADFTAKYSRTTSQPTGLIENLEGEVPGIIGWEKNTYGFEFKRQTQSDLFFARSGYSFESSVNLSSKTLTPNNADDSLFSTLARQSIQYQLFMSHNQFIPVSGNWVLQAKLEGKLMDNQTGLFVNDLFRLGGNSSIRGFTDYEFYASQYVLGVLEMRYYASEDLFLRFFYDQAYLEARRTSVKSKDYPFGLGLGLAFATNNGNFYFSYALGKSKGQALSPNLSKIHFGLRTKF